MQAGAVHGSSDLLTESAALGELVDARSMEDVLGSFYALFRIPVRILNDDGTSWVRSRQQSALNDYLGQLPIASKRLSELHELLRHGDAGESGEFSLTAFTGATYHVAVVGHEGRRVGRFVLGPYLMPSVNEPSTGLLGCDPELDAARARELLLALPRVREETVRAIARHLAVSLDVLIFAGHKALLTEYMHLSTVRENARETSQHAEHLQATRERILDLERVKSRLFGVVARELESSLAGLRSVSEQLSSAPLEHSERARVASTIRCAFDDLTGLASRLCELSQVESGALVLNKQRVDAMELVERVGLELRALSPQRARDITVGSDPQVGQFWADPRRVRQVLSLLGQSALSASSAGPIRLQVGTLGEGSASGDADTDGMVLLGAPRSGLEFRIMHPGSCRAEPDRAGSSDSGCGSSPPPSGTHFQNDLLLALVQRLVEAQEGELRVEEPPAGGTCFVVTLPTAALPS